MLEKKKRRRVNPDAILCIAHKIEYCSWDESLWNGENQMGSNVAHRAVPTNENGIFPDVHIQSIVFGETYFARFVIIKCRCLPRTQNNILIAPQSDLFRI